MSFSLFIKSILPYIIFAVLAFIITITFTILFPFLKDRWDNIANNFMKEVTRRAIIVSKRTDDEDYYITFQLGNGRKLELLVDSYFYNYYAEGEKGMLTHQGTRFINFERVC